MQKVKMIGEKQYFIRAKIDITISALMGVVLRNIFKRD